MRSLGSRHVDMIGFHSQFSFAPVGLFLSRFFVHGHSREYIGLQMENALPQISAVCRPREIGIKGTCPGHTPPQFLEMHVIGTLSIVDSTNTRIKIAQDPIEIAEYLERTCFGWTIVFRSQGTSGWLLCVR
jgi:hypothetical protein